MSRAVPIVTAQTDPTSAPAIATNATERAYLLPGSDLTDAHLGSLAQRWITPELARQMQVRSIISDQGAEILGRRPASGDYGGILIPNIRPGQLGPRAYRIRRDHPDIQYKSDGTHKVANKYLSARGDRNMLYFMPSTDAAALGDATLALVVTEGEFKCAALWRLARHGVLPADPRPRFLPCALQGVWNWLGKTGKTLGPDGEAHDVKGPIPDLDQIVWTDRRVVIVFDVDVRTKEDVAGARRKLTHELQGRGAKVFWANLPAEPGVKGIDDLLYRKGPELAVYLIDHATPAKPPRKRVPLSDGVEVTNGATAPASAAARKQGQYEATGSKLIWWRPAGEDLIPTPLANFDARITSEIVKDDGTEQRRFYEITATYKENSDTFQVAATEFGSLNWVADRLPAECLCYAGRGIKDHLPVAIKSLSGTIPRRRIFTHTGWATVASQKVYLHTGGAIGAGGVVEGIQVELPAELGQFCLPPLGQGKELIEAIYTTLKFLDVAPRRITVPLFLTAYRAALGEANFSLFLYGESGVRKTSLAAIVQQHFGAAMDYDHAPANWESTDNFIETLAHAAKDAALLIDDFVPSGARHDVQPKYALADRLFRGQANRQGRGRLQSDTSYRATRKPRGIPVGTGEELPRGRSLQARMLSILVVPGDVDLDLLKKVQDAAGDGQCAMAMAGFIHYVAEHFEEVQQQRRLQNQAAREAAARTTAHGRGVAIRMELSSTANILSRFFTHAGAMTETYARVWLNSIGQALAEVACEREEQEQEVDTARRSLEFLQTAITRGDAYLTDPSEQPPEHPEQHGWRKKQMGGTVVPSFEWEPRGAHIGWVDDEGIYLDSAAAFAAIQCLARETDEPLAISAAAWHRSLDTKGFVRRKEANRGVYTCRKTLGDRRREVLWLFSETLGGTKATDHSDHDKFGVSD